jgi:hypothetical protein
MKKIIMNPMPESLDEANIDLQQEQFLPGDAVTQGGEFNTIEVNDAPGLALNAEKRKEVVDSVNNSLTTDKLNDEILNERIQQDINVVTKSDRTLSNAPKDILKSLIAKGKHESTKVIRGHTWKLRALSQNEFLQAMEDVQDETSTNTGRISNIMFSQVIYAVEACDGIPIYEWFNDTVKRENYDTKEAYQLAVRRVLRAYFSNMAPAIIDEFYQAYVETENERNEALEELKND